MGPKPWPFTLRRSAGPKSKVPTCTSPLLRKNPNSSYCRSAALLCSRRRPHYPPRCQYGRLAPSQPHSTCGRCCCLRYSTVPTPVLVYAPNLSNISELLATHAHEGASLRDYMLSVPLCIYHVAYVMSLLLSPPGCCPQFSIPLVRFYFLLHKNLGSNKFRVCVLIFVRTRCTNHHKLQFVSSINFYRKLSCTWHNLIISFVKKFIHFTAV